MATHRDNVQLRLDLLTHGITIYTYQTHSLSTAAVLWAFIALCVPGWRRDVVSCSLAAGPFSYNFILTRTHTNAPSRRHGKTENGPLFAETMLSSTRSLVHSFTHCRSPETISNKIYMLISSTFNAAGVQQPAGVCYNRLRETIIPTSSPDALADVSDWLQIHVFYRAAWNADAV